MLRPDSAPPRRAENPYTRHRKPLAARRFGNRRKSVPPPRTKIKSNRTLRMAVPVRRSRRRLGRPVPDAAHLQVEHAHFEIIARLVVSVHFLADRQFAQRNDPEARDLQDVPERLDPGNWNRPDF